ncbi:MAG: RIP metalloprotease RseP [Cyanobacteria bacterium P01_H01_bin.15]
MFSLAAIAVLGLLIVVHELGHFAAARLQGIRVSRFSIGFGPVLARYQGPQTEYAIRALLLGGYVGFPDDDPDSDIEPDDPDLLRNRPVLDRAIVISAGVIANLVFAYLLIVGQGALIGFQEFQPAPGVLIPQVMQTETSAAYQAGIQAGDVVLKIEGIPLDDSDAAIKTLQTEIQNSPSQELTLEIQRGPELLTVPLTPADDGNGVGKVGVHLTRNGAISRVRPKNIGMAFSRGAENFQRICFLTVQGFGQLITNFQENVQQVAGPIGIVAAGAELASNDLANLFQFAALISINLAVINILPLPALDGGQLAFLVFEGLMGKPVPVRIQEGIMQTGLVLLLGLGVVLIVRDTVNLPGIQQLLM